MNHEEIRSILDSVDYSCILRLKEICEELGCLKECDGAKIEKKLEKLETRGAQKVDLSLPAKTICQNILNVRK